MKILVKLQVINPVSTGMSATGRAWKRQDVVVNWPETLSDGRVVNNYQMCCLMGEQVDRLAELNPYVGMELMVDIAFNTRESNNGHVYNSNSIYIP